MSRKSVLITVNTNVGVRVLVFSVGCGLKVERGYVAMCPRHLIKDTWMALIHEDLFLVPGEVLRPELARLRRSQPRS